MYQGKETEEKVFEKKKGFLRKCFKRSSRGRKTDRNSELVPDSWNLIRERALT